jgi:NAD(P)-dependent dehydrogenase (short-subunit alcohol dehydrogenase family)
MAQTAAAGERRRMTGQARRRALVTGASGALGSHFARTLARSGMRVALGARRVESLSQTVSDIAADGGDAMAVALDVTDPASVAAAMETVVGAMGGLDVLVNNAGIATTRPLLEQSEADWGEVLDVNLTGAWRMAQAAARQMAASESGGSIIHIASILGLRVAAQVPAYVASKAGLIHLTRAMALELARYDIRVNAIAPATSAPTSTRRFSLPRPGRPWPSAFRNAALESPTTSTARCFCSPPTRPAT